MSQNATAQVAMEYLIVFSMAFFMIIPLIIIFNTQTNNMEDDIEAAQLTKLTAELIDAAEEVYFLGTPSQKQLTINFPTSILNITIENNGIVVYVERGGEVYPVYQDTLVNLTGTLRNSPGQRYVKIVAQENEVLITDE